MFYASLSSSIDGFISGVGDFFASLADAHWSIILLAIGFHFLNLLFRTRAWFNVLRAAYPGQRFRWRNIFGSYMAGVGINSVFPIHGGDVVKVLLAKRSIPKSNYPSVASSFLVESIFDMTIGLLVLIFAFSQGVLPSFIQLPDIPAFGAGFWLNHPKFLFLMITVLFVLAVVAFALLARKVKNFWGRIKQGLVILRDRRRYLREVASWQLAGWVCKLTCFYFFLEAFNVATSFRNAMLVMSVQALSTLMPFTPGGAGAQQALLVYMFRDVASKTLLLSYGVGQQVFIAAFNAIVGFTCIYLMARTLNWKALRHHGEREKARDELELAQQLEAGVSRREPEDPTEGLREPHERE